jgi:hypothetical protein
MERWIGSCRRELLDRTLIWNRRHLMLVLREYEDFYNSHRPHRAPPRPPDDLAPGADAIRSVLAAAHQAVDALACVAMTDLTAVEAADRAGRLYVPTRLLTEYNNIPRRFATTSLVQFRELRNTYLAARDAGVTARLALDSLAIAARTPGMTLALARAAALDQSPRRTLPDNSNLFEPPPDYSPFRRSRASTGGTGPLEQAIRDSKVSDPVILLRAIVIDNAAERLIEQADSATSATGSPERRENWQRAVRRAALLADENFPHAPVTEPSADTQHTGPGKAPVPPTTSRTNTPSRYSGPRN